MCNQFKNVLNRTFTKIKTLDELDPSNQTGIQKKYFSFKNKLEQ
jgi:hypothetical protein